MSNQQQRIALLLDALFQAVQLPTPFYRRVAIQTVLENSHHRELIALCAVMAEGNMYGADAARAMAEVA